MFKEELTPSISQTVSRNRKGRKTSNSFSDVSITVIPKPDKDMRRKLQNNIPYEYRHKASSTK